MRYAVVFVGLLSSGGAALAGEKPIYAAAPDWVKPAPEVDTAKIGSDAPIALLFDAQQKLEDGQTWSYVDVASRAASAEALGDIGTIKLQWQPAHGDLILHRAEIIRGAERIDVLKKGASLSVLRREEGLERRAMNGALTATMPVEGLRVGDVLRLTYSITSKDPTLKGNVQAMAPLMVEPFRVQFARVRLLWPKGSGIKWRPLTTAIKAEPVVNGAYEELNLALPLPKPVEIPNDAPLRFQNLPLIEASSFPDWSSLAAVMAPLYETKGLIGAGSPLAAEVDRIEAATADPLKRTALALQLVQEKVRYQMMGMANGNYVPQKPVETWSLRYGDCKAKTLLLLAVLHQMGIEAEPVLANSQLGDLVPSRLPSAAAFDHVFVRATVNGESLWIDGTASGARLADIRDTPPFGHVLPVRASGAALMTVPRRAPAQPLVISAVELDQSAGINFPAPFTATVTMRGATAEMLKVASAQASKEDLERMAEQMLAPSLGNLLLVSQRLDFDDLAGTATLSATGIASPGWKKQKDRWSLPLDPDGGSIQFAPDRARQAWRDIPVLTGPPSNMLHRVRIKLPGKGAGFTLEGADKVSETFGAMKVDRSASQSGGWLTVESHMRSDGSEVPASAIPDVRKRLAQFQARSLRSAAPGEYPAYWQDVEAAKRDKTLEPVLAALSKRVSAKPDEAQSYVQRAGFYASIFEREKAIADFGRAIELQPSVNLLLGRASLHEDIGDRAKAIADAERALEMEPSSDDAAMQLALLKSDAGDRKAAEALLQERIETAGDDKGRFLAARAEVQAEGGEKEAALATMDEALADNPSDPTLLNSRCWVKGTMNVALDTALKDCTKSIELSEYPAQALDSRAMVYFRMNRFEDALADLNAALAQNPQLAASLYLRGIVHKRTGKAEAAAADLAAARLLEPRIVEKYEKYGIKP